MSDVSTRPPLGAPELGAEHRPAEGGGGDPLPPALAVGVAALIVVLPILAAAWVVRSPTWFPSFDNAMIELNVRDVGTSHTPLLGLTGRIGELRDLGNHPGPLSFWVMAPAYRLFGSSSWALVMAGVTVHVLAVVTTCWVALRRGGPPFLAAVALAGVVLVRALGPDLFVDPWNPYLPVLWWVAFVLAAWSVACRDWPVLPVAVFAASFCVQTHIPYLPTIAGVTLATFAVLGVGELRRRQGPAAPTAAPDADRRARRWWTGSLVFAVVLWIGPIVDQVTSTPGNMTRLARHFLHPTEPPVGLGRGVELVLTRFDPGPLLSGAVVHHGPPTRMVVPGLVLLVLWASAAVVTWRRRLPVLGVLHVVLGAAVVFAGVGAARIFGPVHNYLLISVWGLGALLALATGVTVAAVLRGEAILDADATGSEVGPGTAVIATVAALVAVLGVAGARTAQPGEPVAPRQLAALVPATADALRARGEGGERFVVATTDPTGMGGQNFGMLVGLERRGFDVKLPPMWEGAVGEHRVVEPSEAAGELRLVVGPAIDALERILPNAPRLAATDHRTPEDVAEQERLISQIEYDLRRAGLTDLAGRYRQAPLATSSDPAFPPALGLVAARVREIGYASAVYRLPPPERQPEPG